MRSLEDIAESWYGSKDAAPAAAPSPSPAAAPDAPRTLDQVAENFYKPKPAPPLPDEFAPRADVVAMRAQEVTEDLAIKWYPPKINSDIESAVKSGLVEHAPEVQREVAHEYSRLLHDIGGESADVRTLQMAHNDSANVDPARAQAEAHELLKANYGARAGEALEAARALVRRDPRLHKLLSHGAGNDARVVARLAELGMRQKQAGRLK